MSDPIRLRHHRLGWLEVLVHGAAISASGRVTWEVSIIDVGAFRPGTSHMPGYEGRAQGKGYGKTLEAAIRRGVMDYETNLKATDDS